jgi:hypothetical protein
MQQFWQQWQLQPLQLQMRFSLHQLWRLWTVIQFPWRPELLDPTFVLTTFFLQIGMTE